MKNVTVNKSSTNHKCNLTEKYLQLFTVTHIQDNQVRNDLILNLTK